MKIIRPEQPVKKIDNKEENLTLIIDNHEVTPFTEKTLEFSFNPEKEMLIDDYTKKMDYIVNETLENTKDITFTITLTKKQKELWDKKGGIKWLKKALVGQKLSKK